MVAKGEWSDYENGKKKEYGQFTRKAREFVYAMEPPWQANPGSMGQSAKNDPRALVICLLLKIGFGKPYRDMLALLHYQTYFWPIIGLKTLCGRIDQKEATPCPCM